MRTARVMPAVGTAVRLLMASVWLAAGIYKAIDLAAAQVSVAAYQLVPEWLVAPVGYLLPVVEVAFGVLLLVGLRTRLTALLLTGFDLLYVAAIASAALRGLRIDCGCFSAGGRLPVGVPTHYQIDLVRDGLFLLVGMYLLWRPESYLSLDRMLGGTARAEATGRPPALATRTVAGGR